MIEAVQRFDHARGNRFSTVAVWWIRKAIQRGLEQAPTVRLPIGTRRFGVDGYAPHTPRQIAGQMRLTPHWVRRLEKESPAWMRRQSSRQGLQAWAS
ncbi:hypothetical protein [Nonomuraea sp. NPDC049141]|uniref:hypothetical protein n=1 Tax=Nonomuraea sp. NPDC049141 TaxID=3155500 RepID=UPI0033C90689